MHWQNDFVPDEQCPQNAQPTVATIKPWRPLLASGLAVVIALFQWGLAEQSFGQPALPPVPGEMLNAFHFDDTNNWTSFYGFPAMKSSGVKGVASWQSNAVQI